MTPRGGLDRIDGVRDGALLVRVAAPPVDGAANASLVRLLASALDVPSSSVRVVAGERGRQKTVEVTTVEADALRSRWPDLAV